MHIDWTNLWIMISFSMCEIWFYLEAITHIDQEQTPIINENTEDEQNVKRIIMRCTNLPSEQDEESLANEEPIMQDNQQQRYSIYMYTAARCC